MAQNHNIRRLNSSKQVPSAGDYGEFRLPQGPMSIYSKWWWYIKCKRTNSWRPLSPDLITSTSLRIATEAGYISHIPLDTHPPTPALSFLKGTLHHTNYRRQTRCLVNIDGMDTEWGEQFDSLLTYTHRKQDWLLSNDDLELPLHAAAPPVKPKTKVFHLNWLSGGT